MSDEEQGPDKAEILAAIEKHAANVPVAARRESVSKPGGAKLISRKKSSTCTLSVRQRRASVAFPYQRRASLSFAHMNDVPVTAPGTFEEEIHPDEVPWWTSHRVMLSLCCFIGFIWLYSIRVNISVAIVCMTKDPIHQVAGNTTNTTASPSTTASLPNSTAANHTEKKKKKLDDAESCLLEKAEEDETAEFMWSKKLKGFILGAFFWGYTLMQIPSGYLSDRFGARRVISCGMIPISIVCILCPFLARGSPYLLLVGRVCIGLGEAMMYPGMQSLWARWSPPNERSRLIGFAYGGSQLGNAFTFPFAGLLCAYGFDGGWPSIFYTSGGFCLLWCFGYAFYARDSPAQKESISAVEKKYIEQSLGVYGQSVEADLKKRRQKKPWKHIFTSRPVWAILIANAAANYGAYLLLTQMPTYLKEVLKFDIKSNGAVSMIPYLVFWVFILIGGGIADSIITNNILGIEWTRKLFCALGMVIPAIFLVLTGYMKCTQQVEAVVLLSLSMGFCGLQFSSFFVNHGDIAPRYAGTVFGFTNMGASIPGIIVPSVTAALTPNQTQEEWLLVFYIAGAVYVVGAILYAIMAEGTVQEWAIEEEDIEHVEDLDDIKDNKKDLHALHEHDDES